MEMEFYENVVTRYELCDISEKLFQDFKLMVDSDNTWDPDNRKSHKSLREKINKHFHKCSSCMDQFESWKNREFVNCYKCNRGIPKKRCLIINSFGEDIICGICIRKEQGETSFQFFKKLTEDTLEKE